MSENKPNLEELPRLDTPAAKKNLSALKLPYSSQGSTKPGSFASQPGEITTLSNTSSLGFDLENGREENEKSKASLIISSAKLVAKKSGESQREKRNS